MKYFKILIVSMFLIGCSSSTLREKSNLEEPMDITGTWKIKSIEHNNSNYEYGEELENFSFFGPTAWSKAIGKVFIFDEHTAKTDMFMINDKDPLTFQYLLTKDEITFSVKNPSKPGSPMEKAFVVKLSSHSDTDMVWEMDSVVTINLKKL